MQKIAVLAGVLAAAAAANADIRITEWMYNPVNSVGEFVELRNMGSAPIDMTGWRYDDDSRDYGVGFDLSGFGVVMPGEVVIFTEADPDAFRLDWGLSASVKVLGGVTNNLGRADEINIFNGAQQLVDRLTYADNNAAIGGPRTQGISGNPGSLDVIGANNARGWVLSAIGDGFGSYASLDGDVANPGIFIPSPGAAALLCIAGVVASGRRRA